MDFDRFLWESGGFCGNGPLIGGNQVGIRQGVGNGTIGSDDATIGGPTGELGTIRQLQLAQHGADMRLHGFDGDE